MRAQAGAIAAIIFILVIVAVIFLFLPQVFRPVIPGITVTLSYEPSVVSTSRTTIEAELSNQGDWDALEVEAWLRGLSSEWKIDGEAFEGKGLELGKIPRGEEKRASWKLTAPEKFVEFDYPFEVLVRFNYTSVYDALVEVVSPIYALETNKTGAVLQERTTKGPLLVSLQVPEEGLIVRANRVRVNLTLTNVGGGGFEGRFVHVVDSKGIECSPTLVEFGVVDRKVKDKASVECLIEAGEVEDSKQVEVKVWFNYKYYIIKEGRIKVVPKEKA